MTIKSTGQISFNDIGNELNVVPIGMSLNDPNVRALAGIPSGPISLGSFYGKSANAPVATLSASVSNTRVFPATASSTVTFNSNGTITYVNGGGSAYWYGPGAVAGIGASYWIGVGGSKTDLVSLSSAFVRTFAKSGVGTISGTNTFQIYSDSVGNTKVCDCSVTYTETVQSNT